MRFRTIGAWQNNACAPDAGCAAASAVIINEDLLNNSGAEMMDVAKQ